MESVFSIFTQRKPQFWMASVVMPNFLMSIIGLNIFLIGPQTDSGVFAERLGFIVTMILTSTTFKAQSDDATPTLSYLTLLDKWTLVLFCIFFASSLECTLIQMLVRWFEIGPGFNDFCDVVGVAVATFIFFGATNLYLFNITVMSRTWWTPPEREAIPVISAMR